MTLVHSAADFGHGQSSLATHQCNSSSPELLPSTKGLILAQIVVLYTAVRVRKQYDPLSRRA